jgi:predicted ATPase
MEIESPRGIRDAVVERLRGARALLILDNCEHLLDACRDLALQILTRCPEVQILATSRTRLGIAGEMTFTLPPFACPPADPLPPNELLAYDAVALFVERARLRRPSFALTAATAPAVQQVVRAVEGIPLAVELAASRVGTVGVEAIADRLAASTEVLATQDAGIEERHHSLDATLDWSYSLLDADEAGFFCALAVFRGGWRVEEVERFAGPEIAALDMLGRLADNSLVTVEGAGGGAVRYRLLEPVRQYAQRLLRGANEEPAARARHAAVYAEVASEAESRLRGPDAAIWFRRLDDEYANLRAVLAWSLDEPDGAELGLGVVGSIWRYWFARGLLDEGRDVTRRLLERAGVDPRIDAAVRAAAYNAAGAMAYYQSDEPEAQAMYLQALALRREAGDARGAAATLSNLGLVCKDRGNRDEAIAYFTESRDIFEELQDDRGLCSTLGNIGILYQEHGEFERALPLQERSLALARSIGGSVMTSLNNLAALFVELEQWDRARELLEESLAESSEHGVKRSQAAALVNLGHVYRATGEVDRALAACREALLIGRDQGEPMMVALALEAIAACLADVDDGVEAATLLATAARMRCEAGTPPSPVEQRRLDRTLAAIERSTGAAERDIHPLGDDEAIALALGEPQARRAI